MIKLVSELIHCASFVIMAESIAKILSKKTLFSTNAERKSPHSFGMKLTAEKRFS